MKTAKHLHRFYGIVSLLDGVDLDVLCGMRQQKLVHDLNLVARSVDRCQSHFVKFQCKKNEYVLSSEPRV